MWESVESRWLRIGLQFYLVERGHNFAGLTEGFRGHDGIMTSAAGIKAAGKVEAKAIQKALWGVNVDGVNGDIKFIKQGPAGKESAQNVPNVYVVTIKKGKVALP